MSTEEHQASPDPILAPPREQQMAGHVGSTDVAAAVAFARRFGLPNVMTFVDGRCLHPEVPTVEAATSFVEARCDADLYFCPAALTDVFAGKPKKSDCIGSEWAWVDIDPPKGMTDAAELAAWRERALSEIEQTEVPPAQIVVYSGRGLWLFWRLPHRLAPAKVEAINYALANRFGGGDSCHNIDRVARLPFTRNSKTGRLATVLHDVDGYAPLERLPSETPPDGGSELAELGDLGDPSPLTSEDAFRVAINALVCPDAKKQDLLLSALRPDISNDFRDRPLDVRDRSAVMFSWAMKATMAGMAPGVIRDCILSPALEMISAHVLDPKKYPPSLQVRAATRQVCRAHASSLALGWEPEGAAEEREREAAEAIELVSLAPVPNDLPARPWLVDNLLMDGQVTMLTGRGGDGKSLLALQLAMMVAAEKEFAWWKTRQRRNVLVLNAEDNIDEQRRRLLGACKVMGLDPRLLDNRLFTLNTDRLVLVHREPGTGEIKTAPLFERLVKLIEEHRIGLLVIDPLVEAHVNLDENSNVDMKELVIRLRKLARFQAVPILLVHHSRKGASGGDQDGARGGSALVNACRAVLTVERMSEDEHAKTIKPPLPKERYVRVTGAKANYAGRIGDRWMELVPVELPNGDETPAFRRIVFGEVDEGFDPHTWQHREELLRMISDGRGNGRFWSTALTGRKEARLDAAVSDVFALDTKQARGVVERFEKAGLIKRAIHRGDDRHETEVWVLPDQALPEGTIEIPF